MTNLRLKDDILVPVCKVNQQLDFMTIIEYYQKLSQTILASTHDNIDLS